MIDKDLMQIVFDGFPVEIVAAAALVLERFKTSGLRFDLVYSGYRESKLRVRIKDEYFLDCCEPDLLSRDAMIFGALVIEFPFDGDGVKILLEHDRSTHPAAYSNFAGVPFAHPDFADVIYDRCIEAARVVDHSWFRKGRPTFG